MKNQYNFSKIQVAEEDWLLILLVEIYLGALAPEATNLNNECKIKMIISFKHLICSSKNMKKS